MSWNITLKTHSECRALHSRTKYQRIKRRGSSFLKVLNYSTIDKNNFCLVFDNQVNTGLRNLHNVE